ncbi:MAG: hypothetical protein ACKOA8_19205 [Deltaproteobacteria bacterium]
MVAPSMQGIDIAENSLSEVPILPPFGLFWGHYPLIFFFEIISPSLELCGVAGI